MHWSCFQKKISLWNLGLLRKCSFVVKCTFATWLSLTLVECNILKHLLKTLCNLTFIWIQAWMLHLNFMHVTAFLVIWFEKSNGLLVHVWSRPKILGHFWGSHDCTQVPVKETAPRTSLWARELVGGFLSCTGFRGSRVVLPLDQLAAMMVLPAPTLTLSVWSAKMVGIHNPPRPGALLSL